MKRGELAFSALMFAAVAALLLAGLFVLDYSWTVIAFPLMAGAALCVLCLLDIGATLGVRAAPSTAKDDSPEPLSLASLAWALSLLPFVYALGFVFGSAVYLFTYLRAHGSSWRFSAGVAAASLLVTWGLFIKILHILLPLEPLWWS
jgi:hypothetical protein